MKFDSVDQTEFGRRTSHRALWIVAVLVCAAGCGRKPEPLDIEYGRSSGQGFAKSVNGTLVLEEMLQSKGVIVDRYNKLSPRLDRYETIFWFPSDRFAPPQPVIDRFEEWLSAGWNRQLVLIGRDFDAEIGFWQSQLEIENDVVKKSHIHRELAKALLHEDQARNGMDNLSFASVVSGISKSTDCDWYVSKTVGDRKAAIVRGTLVNGEDVPEVDIRYNTLLQPPEDAGDFYDMEEVLIVDGETFAFTLDWENEWQTNSGKVTVISNGSFLLNYPLVAEHNRVLADKLLAPFQFDKRVLFLHGSSSPPIRSTDGSLHNQWGWITHRPLRYIVPHFLFLGILFSFVFFPIFGRAKRLSRKSTTDFLDHVTAVARLLENSKSKEEAKKWIETYHQRTISKNHLPRE